MNFSDSEGRVWDVSISLGIARRLADQKIINLIDVSNIEETVGALINPVKMLDVLWCIVHKQAASIDVDQTNFEDALDQSSLTDALSAVQEAIRVFTQALEKNMGRALETSKEKLDKILQKRADTLIGILEGPEMEKKMEEELSKIKDETLKNIG